MHWPEQGDLLWIRLLVLAFLVVRDSCLAFSIFGLPIFAEREESF